MGLLRDKFIQSTLDRSDGKLVTCLIDCLDLTPLTLDNIPAPAESRRQSHASSLHRISAGSSTANTPKGHNLVPDQNEDGVLELEPYL